MNRSVLDEIIDRLHLAYYFAGWTVFLALFSPVVVFLESFKSWTDLVGDNSDGVLKKYFSLICNSYFGIFQVLLHGDIE